MNFGEMRDIAALLLTLVIVCAAIAHQAWLRRAVRRLEYDPSVQFQIHRVASWYWVANFPVVAILFFGFPETWGRVGLLLNTFYSLYANLATDYGAVSAALAAQRRSDT